MLGSDILLCAEYSIPKDTIIHESEVLRITGADVLQHYLHELLARQLRSRTIVEHPLAVYSIQLLALCNSCFVRILKFDPPVIFQLGKGCSKISI